MREKSTMPMSELNRYTLKTAGSAIERLYDHEIGDYGTSEMSVADSALSDKIKAVCSDKNALDTIFDAMGDYANVHMRHGFVTGFRCAMRLMFEAGGPRYE